MSDYFSYSVAIRTLGTAGDKYLKTLESLNNQTVKPEAIIVYIAEGYELPKETIGIEKYVYVKKGMVAQRALKYSEIESEYLLCTDDDVYYPPTAIEDMYRLLIKNNGNVIAPDPFPHDKLPISEKIKLAVSLTLIPYIWNKTSGYGRSWWGAQRYRNSIKEEVYESSTNAGMSFLCKKSDFLAIHFEEDLWMDKLPYAVGDDNLMFYRMFDKGLKVLTWYNNGIIHLDAGSSTSHMSIYKRQIQTYCLSYHNYAFWWKYKFHNQAALIKILRGFGFSIIMLYKTALGFTFNLVRLKPRLTLYSLKGMRDAHKAILSGELFQTHVNKVY